MKVDLTSFTNTQLFGRALELSRSDRQSKAFWDSLTDDRRSVVLLMIQKVMKRLAADPSVWVPASLEPDNSDWIELRIRFQLESMDALQLEQLLEEKIARKAVLATLVTMEEELRG